MPPPWFPTWLLFTGHCLLCVTYGAISVSLGLWWHGHIRGKTDWKLSTLYLSFALFLGAAGASRLCLALAMLYPDLPVLGPATLVAAVLSVPAAVLLSIPGFRRAALATRSGEEWEAVVQKWQALTDELARSKDKAEAEAEVMRPLASGRQAALILDDMVRRLEMAIGRHGAPDQPATRDSRERQKLNGGRPPGDTDAGTIPAG